MREFYVSLRWGIWRLGFWRFTPWEGSVHRTVHYELAIGPLYV